MTVCVCTQHFDEDCRLQSTATRFKAVKYIYQITFQKLLFLIHIDHVY